MKKDDRRNYLLLGASLLTVGLLVQFLKYKVLALEMNIFYKTVIIMFMIAVGYSFAGGILAPFATRSLKALQHPFAMVAGPNAGKVLFYIVVYAVLFVTYMLVFTYGLNISSIPTPKLAVPNITI